MTDWNAKTAREYYNITHWSDGFFDIDGSGQLVAYPKRDNSQPGLSLSKLVKDIQTAGLRLPVLLRFNDILHTRLRDLQQAFQTSMDACDYQNRYMPVYPIKVNQQRSVVAEFLREKNVPVGFESGSKPEFLAILALAKQPNTVMICNGYKDREYIRLALIAKQLGHRAFIIIEKFSELVLIKEESEKMGVKPLLGIRVRLASIGKGRWQNTGGEKSKFGLTATQVLRAVDYLRKENLLDSLQLLHFHMGSQIANIQHIHQGIQEGARYYAELRRLGVDLKYMDVGGGLGVDYEGTRSRRSYSMNYTLEEYAKNIVQGIHDICLKEALPQPMIITEAGRAMTAHHAVLLTNVIDVETVSTTVDQTELTEQLSHYSLIEAYHDAAHQLSEAQSKYVLGAFSLEKRAEAEDKYLACCLHIRDKLRPDSRGHRELLDELNEKLADKVFCNFSIFQSIPDVWAIQQVFPVLPLSGLDQKPTRRCVIEDITCDSDGRIDVYVDDEGLESSLPIPPTDTNEKPLFAVFLAGAYQEILGDMHNLFGDTDSVHIELQDDGSYQLINPEHGDTVMDVLRYVHFEPNELIDAYETQISQTNLNAQLKEAYLNELQAGIEGYTYLEE